MRFREVVEEEEEEEEEEETQRERERERKMMSGGNYTSLDNQKVSGSVPVSTHSFLFFKSLFLIPSFLPPI